MAFMYVCIIVIDSFEMVDKARKVKKLKANESGGII